MSFKFNPFTGNFDEVGTGGTTVATDAERLQKSFTAGQDVFTDQIIRLGASQQAFLATNNGTYEQAQAVGIALNDATTGNQVNVLLFGVLESTGFNFSINNPFFLGVNGVSLQDPPTATGEYVVEVGQSLGTGAVFLSLKPPAEILS